MATRPSDSARAGRLAGLLRQVLKGNRPIKTPADAKLFIEAVVAQEPPGTCVEKILSSKSGLEAVRLCVRVDLSPSFIQSHTIKLLDYLSEPEITLLADGQLLQQLLVVLVEPPTLWASLVHLLQQQVVSEEALKPLAWLSLSLLSLPTPLGAGVLQDVQSLSEKELFTKSSSPDVRTLGYKIKNVLQLRSVPATAKGEFGPGGRHDNDFADFRKISIYPTADEFLSTERPFYRQAEEIQELGLETRAAAHLDNQFRLFREDMLGELRNDFQVATGRKKGRGSPMILSRLGASHLNFGDQIRLKSCSLGVTCAGGLEVFSKMKPGARKQFLESNKHFLRHQAFGALCRGDEIFGFASIDRDLDLLMQPRPVVLLRFTDNQALSRALIALRTTGDLKFVVVNTPVFAYESVLRCLQDITELPLQQKLLEPRSPDTFKASPKIQHLIARMMSGLGSKLDASQHESVVNALSSSVTEIQGPPGTGKSFIGAVIAKCLYTLTSKKILVISYTNHALDQFLEDLQDIGIDPNMMIRLGSKSSDRTKALLLSGQKCTHRRSPEAWSVINHLKREALSLGVEMQSAFTEYANLSTPFQSIRDYLEFSEEDRRFFDAFEVPSDDSDWSRVGRKGKRVTEDYLYLRWKEGNNDPGIFKQQAYRTSREIWAMDRGSRQACILRWTRAIVQERADFVQELVQRFNEKQEELNVRYNENKVDILRGKRIIGCTTTGAAMYTKLIRSTNPDVVLVEEAGEVLESHVLTALTQSVQQLILIGDHKQLRPKVNNYSLTVEKGDGFDLNRSLFERLILQGQRHTTLQKQHRAHPDISVLYRELTYPELLDSPKTHGYPAIRGLQDRVIFVNHEKPEVSLDDVGDRHDAGAKASKKNIFEANMVLKYVKYLGQQGYRTKDMVVITPYLGQLQLLRDQLGKEVDPWLSDLDAFDLIQAGLVSQAAGKVDKGSLRISTIDNYQGEESDIVIASLTRSNKAGDIGFMAAPERVNVLLSRARHCLIMLGNMDTFMTSRKGRDTWVPLLESLKAKGHLYDGLPVKCVKHPETQSVLQEPIEFEKHCPDGGCAEPCGAILNCGVHKCKLRCHRITDHSKTDCMAPLETVCIRQHRLQVPCSRQRSGCQKCVEEDKEMERRALRDLELEATRKAKESAYARELQILQDELDHQRRIIKYQQDDDERKKTLEQRQVEVENLRRTAARLKERRQQEGAAAATAAAPQPETALQPKTSDTHNPSGDGGDNSPSDAKEEWEHLKKFECARSETLDRLMGMIGLEEVKQEFLSIKSTVDTTIRQGITLGKERLSCALLGNPGTGKTTVARIYGEFLTSVGVLPGSCFEESTGASLANSGVSGCKKLVEDMLNDGGGVLFIDEAYQLTSGNNPGGQAVLDYLLAEVENLTGKVVFVLAGYNKQMESFFAHNPGLPSRFPIRMKFADYTDDELLHIFELNVRRKYTNKMKCEDGLRGLYCRIIARRIGRGRGREGFGNARTVENTLAIISRRQADRLRRERRSGAKPDDLLFTKQDLIGPEPSSALAKSEAWKKLQAMIGLKAVKEAVRSLMDSIQQNYHRELLEQPPIEYSLNKVFLGSPGTGKTTVAKLYGGILADIGLLSRREVVVKNPSDFVGSVMGKSEENTKGILAACEGKVLVIDEAYGLYGGSGSQGGAGDIYRTAVIDTIVAEVQSVPGDDRCVLLLGYKEQMESMFQNVNPGLSRRFPLSSAFDFEDFNQDELRKILELKLKAQGLEATDQAKRVALEMLDRARNRPNFGNGGEVDIILDKAKGNHQKRFSRRETKTPSTLDAVDFDESFDRAERSETNIRMLFAGTVGCEETVELLEGYQETVRTMKKLELDPKESIPFNFLFRGPPGTGKTTTARKMGKVFCDMGFLATAEVVECSATDLIGQYVGQTGPKVQQLLDKALGKVLFVDEAYRLAEGGFAKEAMDELVDSTTKSKYAKKLVIILAGYEHDINRLMSMNPGLTSRFPETIDFRTLPPAECVNLLTERLKGQQKGLENKHVRLDLTPLENNHPPFQSELCRLFKELSVQDGWASARDVLTLAQKIFNKAIKVPGAIAKGCVVVDELTVLAELHSMLNERVGRAQNIKTQPRPQGGLSEAISMLSMRPPNVSTSTETACAAPSSKARSDEPEGEPPLAPTDDQQHPQEGKPRGAIRDAGVSDEVWEQLQRDKKAEDEREDELQRLQEAAQTAREAERAKIVERLLRERERQKKEAEMRRKLETMGLCPAGYSWIKQAEGFRCGGGSHYISNGNLGMLN